MHALGEADDEQPAYAPGDKMRRMSNTSDGGTVWILGAGFSRGLNAPLFRELFMSDRRVAASGLNLPGPDALGVMAVYRKYSEGSPDVLWRDPEEFIDVLESARKPGRALALLTAATSMAVPQMVDAARRILAIECSHFLRGADPTTERWQPYLMWGSRLGASDTVVSFNYDRVLEVLQNKCPSECNYYSIIVPTDDVESEVRRARMAKCAPILKLHGSVDWLVTNGRIGIDAGEDLPARASSGSDIVLAVPGPDKGDLGKRFPEIGKLWRHAEDAVSRARRIVFLGYRFPVTDASARVRFLEAIKAAIRGDALQKIEIVLGPDENHPDVARMKGLLSFVCAGTRVTPKVLPLFVQDFLPFSRDA